jgi:predicted RNA-binding Zn ribbon-like protein
LFSTERAQGLSVPQRRQINAEAHLRQTLESEDLSIRYVNTVAWRLREPHEERLESPTVLLDWLEWNVLARSQDLRLIRKVWSGNPREALRSYRTAIQLREAMYDLFTAHIARRHPSPSALSFFGQILWGSSSRLRLEWEAGRLKWRMTPGAREPLELLRPIALSAAELMTGTRAHKIRQRQDDHGCGWLLVDVVGARSETAATALRHAVIASAFELESQHREN